MVCCKRCTVAVASTAAVPVWGGAVDEIIISFLLFRLPVKNCKYDGGPKQNLGGE